MPRRLPLPLALVAALAAFAALACDDGPAPRPTSATVEVGSGVGTFVAIEDGATLRITEGIQGGFHVFAAVRAQGFEPLDATVAFALYQGDTQIGGARYLEDLQSSDGAWVLTGATVFLFPGPAPEALAGTETRLTVRLSDAEGRVGEAEVRITPACCDYLR